MEHAAEFLFLDRLIEEIPNADLFFILKSLKEQFAHPENVGAQLAAKWYFHKDRHIDCLTACSCYCAILEQSERLFTMVSSYYAPYMEQYKSDYKANCDSLKNYIWYEGDILPEYEALSDVLIYQNETFMIYMERSTGNMKLIKRENTVYLDSKAVIFAGGIAHLSSLEQVVSKIDYIIMEWQKRAFFAYYESARDFVNVLQTGPIERILKNEFAIFLIGWKQAESFLIDDQCQYVEVTWFGEWTSKEQREQIQKDLRDLQASRSLRAEQKYRELLAWYRSNAQRVKNHIKCGKPKILFVTSRFSTAVQYHSRDCMEMCRHLGLEVQELKEKSDLHALYGYTYVAKIYSFRPDVIFCIDHFRHKDWMPPEIVHVCWVQDPLKPIVSTKTPSTLTENDYILSHLPSKSDLVQIGYIPKKILEMPVTANDMLYKPYELNILERKQYECDICIVANAGSYPAYLEKLQASLPISNASFIQYKKIFDDYYRLAYSGCVESDSRDYIFSYFRDKLTEYHVHTTDSQFNQYAERFFLYTRAVIHRSVMVEWLLDGGFKNIKLYGTDWMLTPKFKPYSMGVAKNGEILAKIYKAAKITLGTNPCTTGAARVYECYLSGGFYISNHIQPENDIVNIRDHFKEGVEIPFFYTKEDLYKKIRYYLDNEEERMAKGNLVREKMMKCYTYKASMRRMIEWLQERMCDNE